MGDDGQRPTTAPRTALPLLHTTFALFRRSASIFKHMVCNYKTTEWHSIFKPMFGNTRVRILKTYTHADQSRTDLVERVDGRGVPLVRKRFRSARWFMRELRCLRRLQGVPHFPSVAWVHAPSRTTFMHYAGERLTNANCPSNWKTQLRRINDELRRRRIYHNDVWPANVT